jgi:hypothetical protein
MGARGRLAILLLGALLVAVACTSSSSPGTSPSKTISPSDPSASSGPVSPVVGTVASVDPALKPSPGASPGKTPKPTAKPTKTAAPKPSPTPAPVTGFTLLTIGGETLTFKIGKLDNADDFPPSDLYDRLTTEDPIRVDFTIEGDTLVVYHIEDAG